MIVTKVAKGKFFFFTRWRVLDLLLSEWINCDVDRIQSSSLRMIFGAIFSILTETLHWLPANTWNRIELHTKSLEIFWLGAKHRFNIKWCYNEGQVELLYIEHRRVYQWGSWISYVLWPSVDKLWIIYCKWFAFFYSLSLTLLLPLIILSWDCYETYRNAQR